MAVVFLGLGSNLGDREANLHSALSYLEKNHISIDRVSTIIETDPVGGPPQPKFLNAVAKTHTDLEPQELLRTVLAIEHKLGRIRDEKNGPRTIDIDILLYNNAVIKTPSLTVPHPRMRERTFVMGPLKELDPDIEQSIPNADHTDHCPSSQNPRSCP